MLQSEIQERYAVNVADAGLIIGLDAICRATLSCLSAGWHQCDHPPLSFGESRVVSPHSKRNRQTTPHCSCAHACF
jgi:hypothetical protein